MIGKVILRNPSVDGGEVGKLKVISTVLTQPPTELKNGEDERDGHDKHPLLLVVPKHQKNLSTKRTEIEATLRHLKQADAHRRNLDAVARELQRDLTRSLVKLMHLDTIDQAKIVTHTAHVSLQHEIDQLLETLRRLEDRYQQEKKNFAAIPDKNERHHQVQLAKERRDDDMQPFRERLNELDPTARPPSSFQNQAEPTTSSGLPSLGSITPQHRKASSAVYRKATDQIRELQKTRKSMVDPYMANLKMAKLWNRINDPERALENYEMALKSLSENETKKIPADHLHHVLEMQRRRRREALEFLFTRALSLKEREEAARLMKRFLELATPSERHETATHLERILREQDYIEDPSLATPEAVTLSILCSNSLGPLSNLRFELLQELLLASPSDPYLLESVANFHIRKSDFHKAKEASDEFVKLPQVKRMQLFSTFGEYTPSLTPRNVMGSAQ